MNLISKWVFPAILYLFVGMAHAADVVVGVPNWPTAAATSYILKVVMEEELGLNVEMQNGTNSVIFEGMDRGSIDVHPEVWLPNQQNLSDKYVKGRGTVKQSPNGILATQGMCVTKAISEKYNIKNVSDLTDPKIARLFDRNGDGLGEMWIGEPSAASGPVERVRAKSYGYDQTFTLQEVDVALHLAALDASVKSNTPYVFFCYAPQHLFTLYELVKLKEPPHNPSTWHVLQPSEDPEWLAKSNADSAWPDAYLYLHYAKSLEGRQPVATAFLRRFKLSSEQLNSISYAMAVDKLDPASFAESWVKENPNVVQSWLHD
ncbi:glycine betaine ABC transporter substrate-binding protein [Pseudomonas sp. MPC6]|uniref:ABC transporter substrate-binding protein n=1 Tax=unclassified Pseudomonas TaxID=196821 RepID=UPI001110CC8B|nr:glycine betaine ABC transporter substrate-binding protein [Pseudomonas sp. MPC6]QCY09530.1 amino acid-binding protein [Pseudomonas sp. MPC6]